MATRAPFLTTPYSGYLHNHVPPEDEELTHVGPGTPGGEYLRRFWHPVIRSDALQDVPVRSRVLEEDLVVFRDQSGRVGLLEHPCPHWGTSLEFGVVCETVRTTTWSVPLDDTHPMILGFRRLDTHEEPPTHSGFGQTADCPYAERQRVPGDYDAQTSIHWGMSRHGLERLATTDRGVIMTRTIIRQGIPAVQQGQDPEHVLWQEGQVVPTSANRTVILTPPAATPDSDAQFVRETGRKLAEG